ncbi:hypothetical protein EV359DRAFT_691, partial [Lentinula novae-zelandiae]
LYVLARMKEFVLSEDVAQVIASRSLLALIERVVATRLKLTDIEPLEVVRQLMLLQSMLFRKIRSWSVCSVLEKVAAPRTKMVDLETSNRIADWAAESVLSKENSRKRA